MSEVIDKSGEHKAKGHKVGGHQAGTAAGGGAKKCHPASASEPHDKLAAIGAVRAALSDVRNVRIVGTVEHFLGGILNIVSYADSDEPHKEVQVLVKCKKTKIFWSTEDLANFVATSRMPVPILDRISSADFVVAFLSLLIVIVAFAAFFFFKDNKEALNWVGAPMSIVLGFWFGRGYLRSRAGSPDF